MEGRCEACGVALVHRAKATRRERAARRYCSKLCANRSHTAVAPYVRMLRRVHAIPGSGCWLFAGATDDKGYGLVSSRRGSAPLKAHRVSYEYHHGPIPRGLLVCHKCDTPACVNPEHLFLGTQLDNMRDCSAKGRLNPDSRLNLRPGHPGYHGAGPTSLKE